MRRRLMGWSLRLSDGNRWWITSRGDTGSGWAKKLATILQLKESEWRGGSKLILSVRDRSFEPQDKIDNAVFLPLQFSLDEKKAWQTYDLSTICIWYNKAVNTVICEVRNDKSCRTEYINMWFSLLPIFQRSINLGGLPLHGGLIEVEGKGVIIAAAGGTGKSTCCNRLPSSWEPLSDDESLIVMAEDNQYEIHPFPTWSDYLYKRNAKTWDVQSSLPLTHIFFLEQAQNDGLVQIGKGEAGILLTESAMQVYQKYWASMKKEDQKQLRREFFDNACKIIYSVPTFKLRATLTGSFWKEMENVL